MPWIVRRSLTRGRARPDEGLFRLAHGGAFALVGEFDVTEPQPLLNALHPLAPTSSHRRASS
jgi:hypothetical protein